VKISQWIQPLRALSPSFLTNTRGSPAASEADFECPRRAWTGLSVAGPTVKRVTANDAPGPAAVAGAPPRPASGPPGLPRAGEPSGQAGAAEWPLAGLPQPLAELDFVIVDVETTGWVPEEARITEIGAVLVSGGQVQAEFRTLVNPGSAIPADITALTGITDAMVSQAPVISAALPRFLAFARGCVLTAHNAAFDIGFLSAACGTCGVPWPAFPVLDTVTLARLVLGADEVPDCKLGTLASFFRARTLPCHRALPDALATAEVLQGLLRRLAVAGVGTLAELRAS
jgi:DNA polymerase-3 subunit epsilon